jgi:DNA-directed RNA polymerase subunit beta'
MVLGCYYLTAENSNAQQGAGRYFASLDDALKAYAQGQLDLHASIWVRHEGDVETEEPDTEVLKTETLDDGSVVKHYRERKVREAADGQVISQFIRTTPGRIVYNKTIQEALAV